MKLPGIEKQWYASEAKRPPALRRHFLSRAWQWHQPPEAWARGVRAYEADADGEGRLVSAWPASVEQIVLDRLEPEPKKPDRAEEIVCSILDAKILSRWEGRVLRELPYADLPRIAIRTRRKAKQVRDALRQIRRKIMARPDLRQQSIGGNGK